MGAVPQKEGAKLKPAVQPIRRGEETQGKKQPLQAPQAQAGEGRCPTGIAGLDELLGGGLEPSSTTLVMGEAGCGKTTFLAQFIYKGATDYGEPGVLLSFEEPSVSIMRHMQKYGFDFAALEEQNLFASINYRPHEVKKLVDEGGGLIWDTISSLGAKRLAIDSLTSYAMLFESHYQAREAELALFDLLHKWQCTTMLSGEGLHTDTFRITTGMEYLTDTVILLHHPRYQSVRYRALEVLKMRGSKHSEKLVPFEFVDGEGIRVYPGENIFYSVKEKED
ncbi:MAG: hypothetical protein N3E51_03420 [Candidatus Micrarchaeota archaeon]|nr:hypothetical protein [Candidatus Micrarchaeota archaeon]